MYLVSSQLLQVFSYDYVYKILDEEIGGTLGMELFVKTDFFKQMNVGFGLDESITYSINDSTPYIITMIGVTSDTDAFLVFKGERNVLC